MTDKRFEDYKGNENLLKSVDTLLKEDEISVRLHSVFSGHSCQTAGEVLANSYEELFKARQMGKRSMTILKESFDNLGMPVQFESMENPEEWGFVKKIRKGNLWHLEGSLEERQDKLRVMYNILPPENMLTNLQEHFDISVTPKTKSGEELQVAFNAADLKKGLFESLRQHIAANPDARRTGLGSPDQGS